LVPVVNADVSLSWSGRVRARSLRRDGGARLVVIDVDGCLTDGKLYVDDKGQKTVKAFGPDDHAAIQRWRGTFGIEIITSDWTQISVARASHMGVNITKADAGAAARIAHIQELATLARHDVRDDGIVYIGDGYHDADVMRAFGFGIAPAGSWPGTLRAADAITSRHGGDRAVAQALDYVGMRLLS
jgi:3-deoxy-D-manno-octulosonate 8-phosphate phosphatase (KDO 8-P phosphatase)